jgi:stage IV sporulation protein FB
VMTAFLTYQSLFSTAPEAPLRVASWAIAVFVSILWHELGHAVLQRKFGQQTEIELNGFGGLAKGSGSLLSRTRSIIVSAGGPVAGLALGGAIYGLSKLLIANGLLPQSTFLAIFIHDMLWINIGWSLINLAPVLPLDGGRILESINGPQKMRETLKVCIGAGIAMIFIGMYFSLAYMPMIFAFLTMQNFQALQSINRPRFPGGFPGGTPGRRSF